MRFILIILITSLSGLTSFAQKGFKSIFDGKTTAGWHTYGKKAAGSAWVVDNGTLAMNPEMKGTDGGGDLVTDKEYKNFHLKLEWKVAPKGNSGIIFYVKEDTAKYRQTYSSGPEMQVLDNEGHPDGDILKHQAGDLYDLIKSNSEAAKPVGEWNLAEIISKNGQLKFKLNGKTVVSTAMWDENWKKLIAGSKFANWAGFGTFKSGKIALQDHGDKVWYRNIRIKEL